MRGVNLPLTTALLDRLGHHAHILTTKGSSFRTSAHRRNAGGVAADGSGSVT